MIDPPRPAAPAPPWPTMLRIGAAGAICAAIVAAAGLAAERAVFGADATAARARIETRVSAAFDRLGRDLRDKAEALDDGPLVREAAAGDTLAARELFVRAGEQVDTWRDYDVAVTVYGIEDQPIAWAGRPSDLPTDRLQGAEAWFLAPGALGLRLVHVRPVEEAGARAGAIATERSLLPRGAQPVVAAPGLQSPTAFRLPTLLAPVSIELPFEGPRTIVDPNAFELRSLTGGPLLTAIVAPEDVAAGRLQWRRSALSLALGVLALTLGLLAGPLLDWRRRAHSVRAYVAAIASVAAVVVVTRLVLRAAAPELWIDTPIVSADAFSSSLLWPLLASPFDFLLTWLACGALIGLALDAVSRWRPAARRRRVVRTPQLLPFVAVHLAGGVAAALALVAYQTLLRDTIARTTLDLLHFSLHPVNPAHITMQVGLVIAHAAALGLLVLPMIVLRHWWIVPRAAWRLRLLTVACWTLPLALWWMTGWPAAAVAPLFVPLLAAGGLAMVAPRMQARFRHGSQAFRLLLLALALIVPGLTFYPTVLDLSRQARMRLVETRYAPQAILQREAVYQQLLESLGEIDALAGLGDLIGADAASAVEPLRAFQVWQGTSLARNLTTSSVELYGPEGRLVSRFAFNLPELPEELISTTATEEPECHWEVYGEISPFFAEERRVFHAGRRICAGGEGGATLGSIVVHTILDFENLPFIASRSPYVELLRPADPLRAEGLAGRDVQYAHYGWSGTPDYWSGDTAWTLADPVFARVQEARDPFWTQLHRGSARYHVYLLNDRGGIYALGFPTVTGLDHMVNLAELIVLAAGTFVLLFGASLVYGWLSRRGTTAPALLREVRASFYRKLFLAFVLAVFLPVAALALVTRNYVADQMRANIEQEAIRTASVARRVVEDLVALSPTLEGVPLDDDNLMVWVSRVVGQDVNVFAGHQLVATSERNLFASNLLPTRTPADVYHAIDLRNEATTVARERIGRLEYLVAGTSLAVRQFNAVLTVPLTSRQQEIEAQIDTLDRRVLLGALLFILAGAGLGYTMAERIADPVNRLTRATRRIARGDLDARIAATSSDELRRLVHDFNSMAAELQRQRRELERTNRLEAWAEMARQVAHDIKNPLTPIQLNAEHLRRVHADRGEPLGRVLHDCVETILAQVRLLRQIASEFSNFASSPVVRTGTVDAAELLHEVIGPYRAGLEERIRFEVDIPADLPPVEVDRTLIARALTNVIENALHAMPGPGTLTMAATAVPGGVRVRVADTGVGMDAEALARAFEPYFSTKATGTGIGLPIAKRNVELSGGTITVASTRGEGTTVEMTLPLSEHARPDAPPR